MRRVACAFAFLLLAACGGPDAASVPAAFENAIGMRFVLVPAGRFPMGSPESEERRGTDETLHDVTLSKPFYLAVHETTNAQFRRFRPGHRSGDHEGASLDGDRQPVVRVSHDDALAFVQWLRSEDPSHDYRLPSEAEWERACRAGTSTPFSTGATIAADRANFDGKTPYGGVASAVYRRVTTDVGSFPPNPFGLFDMHGNVWEWTADRSAPYPPGHVTDPTGPPAGEHFVRRGGGWGGEAASIRSAYRYSGFRAAGDTSTGFRVAASAAPR